MKLSKLILDNNFTLDQIQAICKDLNQPVTDAWLIENGFLFKNSRYKLDNTMVLIKDGKVLAKTKNRFIEVETIEELLELMS
jgi:hypothetical protein